MFELFEEQPSEAEEQPSEAPIKKNRDITTTGLTYRTNIGSWGKK